MVTDNTNFQTLDRKFDTFQIWNGYFEIPITSHQNSI